jgi:type IV secretion system protein VirB10
MAESTTTGTTPITDRRPTPRGVLPRGIQTWLMAGIAGVILLIIVVAGRPEQAARRAPAAAPASAPSSERLRDYQDRLRIMETRAAQDSPAPMTSPAGPPAPVSASAPHTASQDVLVAERRRRDYESLFASNIVLSRRPDSERPDRDRRASAAPAMPSTRAGTPLSTVNPTIDDVADAVVRATARASVPNEMTGIATHPPNTTGMPPPVRAEHSASARVESITPAGLLSRLPEGTVIDTVLTNRLDGAMAAPVNCLVTNAMYARGGTEIVIPAGARVLGETKPVQAFGEMRLAVAFHRLMMPDGHTYSLDQVPGLNQIGDAGLRDQVNQHYASTFGAAAAVGLISGLSQLLGTAAFNGRSDQRAVILSGGSVDATAQASLQVMNRFLNRLPTITIREGHRVKVYLTSDLELPVYGVTTGS